MENEKKFVITVTQKPDHYYVLVADVGETVEQTYRTALESERFDPANAEARRFAQDNLYFNLGHMLRGRQFPKDTIICDTVTDQFGTHSANPRFPDEVVAAT